MHYIIANNRKFDISKVAERLNEGDTVMWLNHHFGYRKLRSHPIYSKCSHEIFFNFRMPGTVRYRRHSDAFSKVYWAKRDNRLVPSLYRSKRVSQLLKKGDTTAAIELYFKKESSAIIPVLYTPKGKLNWSAGHKALRYLLISMEPHCIKLAGFTFQGNAGHPWAAEKKFARIQGIEIIN